MTANVELLIDPYSYDFHEDPYPYYRRLRDEATHGDDDGAFAAPACDRVQGIR